MPPPTPDASESATEAWQPQCVICAAHGRHLPLPAGHVCLACHDRIADRLTRIPDLAAHAADAIPPGSTSSGGTRTVPGSHPPLDIDALDASLGLPLVEAVPGDPSSAEPILTLLWSWERAVREDRGLTKPALLDQPVTLVSVCGFLTTHLDWITTDPGTDVVALADHVAACTRTLARHDPDRPARRIRIPCPAPQDAPRTGESGPRSDGQGQGGTRVHHEAPTSPRAECGAPLLVDTSDLGAPVTCPRCREQWTADRLMLVAWSAPGTTAWVDPEAAAYATGVDPSTLRRWARAGRIRRDHGRYDLASIRAAVRHADGASA